jgi:ketosteroid isomerase-like protein
MGIEENRATALRMIDGLSKGEIEEAIVTPDVAWWIPGRGTVSKADFGAIAMTVQGFFKNGVLMTVHGTTAEGDRVAVEAEAYGELKNGKIYNNTYHFMFLFRDGKIYLAKEYNDSKHAADIFDPGTL